ncbi:hypothetical protein JAAARDRAFT_190715 [Jaapia argillacea MUCL 33604]|uniref:Transmembrane protein n=1 Tax=Jaapia argillacea MUCL 33604 TaxID=933084 RepID=A0A067QEU4_9AGAM|nr:hypothetical protein JAAARDRAFT_190715 [Jaapia argillacea MUCL 33604]
MDPSASSSTSIPRPLTTPHPGEMVPNLLPASPTAMTASHEDQLTSSLEKSSPTVPPGSLTPDSGNNDQILASSSPPPASLTSDKPNAPPGLSFATAGLIATFIKRRPAPAPGTSEARVEECSSDLVSEIVQAEKEGHQKIIFFRRHWRIFCAFVVLSISAIGVGVGWALRLHTFDGADSPYSTGIFLWSNLVSIDADQQTMVMDWIIVAYGCGQQTPSMSCPDVNLYFDQNLVRPSNDSTGPSDNNLPFAPIFTLNGTFAASQNELANSAFFRTNIVITNYDTHRTTQSYPFDKYKAAIFMFARVINSTSDFVPVNICKTTGIAVGFNAELTATHTISEPAIFTDIEITRGQVVRVYALFIVIAIWLVTLTFLAASIAVIFFRMAMPAAILALPVAALFAFTQLRSTLPGAPAGFGAIIDFVGILPCLAILTFCSVVMIAVFLFRDPEKGLDPEADLLVYVKQEKKD